METTITLVVDGYKAVDYRPFKNSEFYLDIDGPMRAHFDSSTPYIILEPVETEPAEEAATKFLNGLGDEIKGVAETVERLTERVAALEGGAKKPLPYGLWNLEGGNWHNSSSPFESAGDASRYAHKNFYADWRNYWRVYPYPEDGGKPMELRETPVTVSPGGTNYVYDQPKLPTLWGVWHERDNHWLGSHIGEGSIVFFRSKVASEKYVSDWGGEARPLPIEELIKDA